MSPAEGSSSLLLAATAAASAEHLRNICEFSLNQPPLRPKIDKQGYDELKPCVDRAVALLDWFEQLQLNYAALLGEMAAAGGTPDPDRLMLLANVLDVCIVLENQFGGWSACINRFSWFKRTFAQIHRELIADGQSSDQLNKDIPRFQQFIGAPVPSEGAPLVPWCAAHDMCTRASSAAARAPRCGDHDSRAAQATLSIRSAST